MVLAVGDGWIWGLVEMLLSMHYLFSIYHIVRFIVIRQYDGWA